MRHKKAQSLQINLIVIMILALITLVTVLVIFNRTIYKSESKLIKVADPLEVKSRCLQTWKDAGDANYETCVKRCLDEKSPPKSDDKTCFYS